MTTDIQLAPTDDEILDEARAAGIDWHKHWNDDDTNRLEIFARAVLARWGQPAHSGEPDCAGSGQPITQEDIVESRERIQTCLASALLSGSDREARRAFDDRHKLYSLLGDANCHLHGEIAAPQPVEREPLTANEQDELYWRLHSLSKSLEGSGRIDEHDNPDAYRTILDAMNALRDKKGGQHGADT